MCVFLEQTQENEAATHITAIFGKWLSGSVLYFGCKHTLASVKHTGALLFIILRLKCCTYCLQSDMQHLDNFVFMRQMGSLLRNFRSSSANFLFCLVPSGQLTNQLTSEVNMLVTSYPNRSGSIIIARHQSFVLLQRTHAGWIAPAIVNFPSTSQINILLDTLSLAMHNSKSTSDHKIPLCFLVYFQAEISGSSCWICNVMQSRNPSSWIINCSLLIFPKS